MSDLSDRVVLVTGAAGSLGVHLVKQLLKLGATVRAFDNNEYGLFLLGHEIEGNKERRLLVGDVKDKDRVKMALKGVDYVIHAAALKNIDLTEYNVPEVINTNIVGTLNLILGALDQTTQSSFLTVSSDKAVNPSNLYGATKYVEEKVTLWANGVSNHTRFSCVRMPNFYDAHGNVFDKWAIQQRQNKPLTITDPEVTRWFIKTEDAAAFTIKALREMSGGEIFIPNEKVQERKIIDLLPKDYPWEKIGLRLNEKLNEELYTKEEQKVMEDRKWAWVIRK